MPSNNKHKLKNEEIKKKISGCGFEKMKNVTEKEPKEAWKETSKICLEAAEEVIGRRGNEKEGRRSRNSRHLK